MTAMVGVVRQMRRWWPRRADGLPPGQRALDEFPRFADNPLRPPPSTSGSTLTITSADLGELRIPLDELRSSAVAESRVSDFHCVTTWTARRQTWTGVPLAAWWTTHIGPLPRAPFAVVGAADGYRAVFIADGVADAHPPCDLAIVAVLGLAVDGDALVDGCPPRTPIPDRRSLGPESPGHHGPRPVWTRRATRETV